MNIISHHILLAVVDIVRKIFKFSGRGLAQGGKVLFQRMEQPRRRWAWSPNCQSKNNPWSNLHGIVFKTVPAPFLKPLLAFPNHRLKRTAAGMCLFFQDLHRTGCSLFCGIDAEANQLMLKRVLLGYARWNKTIGYCQGFNMLAVSSMWNVALKSTF